MRKLIHGHAKFHSTLAESQKQLFKRLAEGQQPEALFITCSDSRIDPNLITGTSPGDIFVVRNAGNIVPPAGSVVSGEAATIEYAVQVLGVKHVVVCGHSHCGAMKALLHPEHLQELPNVATFLEYAEGTRRALLNYSGLPDDELLNIAVQDNVLEQLANLSTHASVQSKLLNGEISLHGWVYKIESGEVFTYHHDQGKFLFLAENPLPREFERRQIKLVVI